MDEEYKQWLDELKEKVDYIVDNPIAPVMPWLPRDKARAEVKLWAPELIEGYYDFTKKAEEANKAENP